MEELSCRIGVFPAYSGMEPYAFISYAHSDQTAIHPFLSAMSGEFRFWYDQGLRSGDEWLEVIGERIVHCEVFIVFLSPQAMASRFVSDEILYAYKFAKKVLAVYLEPVNLSRSFELMLQRFQYLECRKFASLPEIIERFLQGLPTSILEQVDTVPPPSHGTAAPSAPLEAEPLEPEPETPALTESEFASLYEVGRVIGKGGSGEVLEVRSRRTGAEYVAKHQHFGTEEDRNLRMGRAVYRNELQKMLLLNDKPYTPTVIDTVETETDSYLVMSRISGLNLRDVIKYYGSAITTDVALALIYEMAVLLRDFHKMDLVYGDVKPSNFILDNFGHLYIVDFGSTCSVDDYNYLKIYTPRYAAPEQRLQTRSLPDFRFDVFGLGMIFQELMLRAGSPDYQSMGSVNTAAAEKVYSRMTAQAPNNRYDTIGEVTAALELICPSNRDEIIRRFVGSFDTWSFEHTDREMDEAMEEETLMLGGNNQTVITFAYQDRSMPQFYMG